MQEQLSVRYSRKAPLTVERKKQLLIWGGLVGPLFLSFLPAMVRYTRDLPMVPIWIFIGLGLSWQLIFYWGHQVTSFKKFKKLPEDEKQVRLVYDSLWHDLMRSGFGLYTFFALIWLLTEFSLGEGQLVILGVFLFSCTTFIVFCVIRREWIVVIAIDGLQKHRRVGKTISVVMSLIAVLPLLSGITRMMQATMGYQAASEALMPVFFSVGTILALAVFLMSFLGVLITIAHHHRWRHLRKLWVRP
jgi:MFS family permease